MGVLTRAPDAETRALLLRDALGEPRQAGRVDQLWAVVREAMGQVRAKVYMSPPVVEARTRWAPRVNATEAGRTESFAAANHRDLTVAARYRRREEADTAAAALYELFVPEVQGLEPRLLRLFPGMPDLSLSVKDVVAANEVRAVVAGLPAAKALPVLYSFVGREPGVLWLAIDATVQRAVTERWTPEEQEVTRLLQEVAVPEAIRLHEAAQQVAWVLRSEAQMLAVRAQQNAPRWDPALAVTMAPALHATTAEAFWEVVDERVRLREAQQPAQESVPQAAMPAAEGVPQAA